MGNPLFNLLGGGNPFQGTPFGNALNLVQQFQQFRNSFRGDPRQQVQDLLNSGQMTQDQFNQLQSMANQFRKML